MDDFSLPILAAKNRPQNNQNCRLHRSIDTGKDLEEMNKLLLRFKDSLDRKLEVWMEPGRFLVAPSGVLLAKVTQTKDKEGSYYIGVNAGFNSLIRPMLYNSYHVCIHQQLKIVGNSQLVEIRRATFDHS